MKTLYEDNQYPRFVKATLIASAVMMSIFAFRANVPTTNHQPEQVVQRPVQKPVSRTLTTNSGTFNEIENTGIFYQVQATNPVTAMVDFLIETNGTYSGFKTMLSCRDGSQRLVIGLELRGTQVFPSVQSRPATYGYGELVPAEIHNKFCR